MNTFDYALLVVRDKTPQCYSTIIELDKYSAYMQHGGTFPSAEGKATTGRGYFKMVNYLREHYKRASTKIRNVNTPMIKLALAAGFVINGLDAHTDGKIFLHLLNEFQEDN